jgi:phosphoribosylanthranilate isomerase
VTRVKVCCIQDVEEMALAVRHGASALGLVSRMPSGPGVLEEAAIRGIASVVPPGVTSVLLTADRDPETIVAQQPNPG